MTVGIVSGLGRQLPSAELMGSEFASFRNPLIIQIDAVINPGSSGGPVLNSRGEVIGVTTAIRSESGAFEGIGFAVPTSTVQRVIPELITSGRVEYPWLGVGSIAVQEGFGLAGLAEPLGLSVESGILIAGVTPGSPAAQAGLQGGKREVIVRGRRVCAGGDIIVAIDGQPVNSMDELLAYLMLNIRPGDQVILQVARADRIFDLPLVLTARPDDNVAIPDCGQD
jgi:2-alkenal reductase